MDALQEFITTMVSEQATGCRGAAGYIAHAKSLGYTHIEPLDTTSSAGDWSILISKDGEEWHILFQENNWPRAGFSYSIDHEQPFYGTLDQVYEQVYECWN